MQYREATHQATKNQFDLNESFSHSDQKQDNAVEASNASQITLQTANKSRRVSQKQASKCTET